MAPRPRQLTLELPLEPRFGAGDFLVARSNHVAYAMIERWPNWPGRVLLITGPTGSGKSHLAAIFTHKARAQAVEAADLASAPLPVLAAHPALVIEDIDRGPVAETQLFHLINLMAERGHFLVLTARQPLSAWGLATADLQSRLRLAMNVELALPDEALLRDVLVKLFADRQLTVEPPVVDYVALHIDRTLQAARDAVERLDREALSTGRRITRALAAGVLAPEEAVGEEEDS